MSGWSLLEFLRRRNALPHLSQLLGGLRPWLPSSLPIVLQLLCPSSHLPQTLTILSLCNNSPADYIVSAWVAPFTRAECSCIPRVLCAVRRWHPQVSYMTGGHLQQGSHCSFYFKHLPCVRYCLWTEVKQKSAILKGLAVHVGEFLQEVCRGSGQWAIMGSVLWRRFLTLN